MTNEDYNAVLELSLNMSLVEAAKFYKTELGDNLRAGIQRAKDLAISHPESLLAQSVQEYNESMNF